jgi:heterotetrameric sarcosine oxidase gamma subunit
MLRRTPLKDRLRSKGAEFGDIAGWDVALRVPGEQGWRGKDGVGMCDLSCLGSILVEGSVLPKSFPAVSGSKQTKKGRYFRLRPDRGLLLTPPDGVEAALKTFSKSKAAATDQTDGHSVIGLLGGAAPLLMRRICGLDFHDSVFGDQTLKASSVAKTRQMIVRWDKGGHACFLLVGQRSLADYLWETAEQAAQGLHPVTLGWEFFHQL